MAKAEEQDFIETHKNMCSRIFAGREKINFDQFMEFRNELQEMLWHYEFYQFNVDKAKYIPTFDFA